MKMTTVVHKMEEYVQDFRAQLEKNDPDSINLLVANTKRFFDELTEELPADSFMDNGLREFQGCVARFGKACEQGNMELAAQALSEMEATVSGLRSQCETKQAMAV